MTVALPKVEDLFSDPTLSVAVKSAMFDEYMTKLDAAPTRVKIGRAHV